MAEVIKAISLMISAMVMEFLFGKFIKLNININININIKNYNIFLIFFNKGKIIENMRVSGKKANNMV